MRPLEAVRTLVKQFPGWKQARKLLVGVEETQWLRIVMDRETQRLVGALDVEKLRVLEISGTSWQGRFPFRSYRSVSYPEFDVCDAPLDEQFDLIIAEQVWEHLLRPYRAARNVHQMLSDGGKFLVTTPFLVRFHPQPYDCSRWSETGMKYFLEECGFPLDQTFTASWGNLPCVRANLHVWRRYLPGIHSLENDPLYPAVVWALATKSQPTPLQ